MLNLILVLLVGSGLVYVSKFNFTLVSVNLGFATIPNVPLFYIIITSVVFGLILSYIFSLIRSVSTSFTLRGKNNEIKKGQDEVLELTRRVHQLELENEKQKNGTDLVPTDTNAL